MSNTKWDEHELETLGHCPICQGTSRTVVYDELTDTLFQCAPGRWTLHACQACGTAYLDPRPTPASMGKAYTDYCTHPQAAATPLTPSASNWRNALRRVARATLNSYRNARWQMELTPSNAWGRLLVPLLFPIKSTIEQQVRHMPCPPVGRKGRLLDVGCGNGEFLKVAQAAGWSVQGIDFDPVAVAEARSNGLAVELGGIEQLAAQKQTYDWITCSHVLEHVHAPLQLIQSIHSLLRPNGCLWLQVPNIDSVGREIYDVNWIGIDPPRHLSLMSADSLRDVLVNAGFKPRFLRLPILSAMAVYAASDALRGGEKNAVGLPLSRIFRPRFFIAAVRQNWQLRHAEFHTVIAVR